MLILRPVRHNLCIYLLPEDLELPCDEPDLEPEDLDPLCDELLLAIDPEFLDPEENERATEELIVLDEFEVIPEFE